MLKTPAIACGPARTGLLMPPRQRPGATARQTGLSLVELMVGLSVGLIIVAAALFAMTQHLRESRALLVETRLMQDLRTTSALIARALRRAGNLDLSDDTVRFAYAGDSEPLAYRLRDGVIEMRIGSGYWQAMTDANTLRVTSFAVHPQVQETMLTDFCSRACPEASASCPPRQLLRSLGIQIDARASTDPLVTRSVNTTVRLRNDALTGACPT